MTDDKEPKPRTVLHFLSGGKDIFGEWLDGLRDRAGRAAILKRIDRVEEGNFGDYRPVGEGVFEIRVHFGPGYRVYYGLDGTRVVLLLCGGDKATQRRDVQRAHGFWRTYRGMR